MQKNLKLFITLLFVQNALSVETFTLRMEKSETKVELIAIDGILFSKSCQKKCMAKILLKSLRPTKKIPKYSSLAGNPASEYCNNQGGKNLILRNQRNQQYDFCQFKDKSLVDSWKLYYAK